MENYKKRVVVETITLSIDTTSNKSNCKNRYSCAINRFGSLFIYTFAVSCKSADGQTDREKYIRTHSIETFKKPTIEDHNNYSNEQNLIESNCFERTGSRESNNSFTLQSVTRRVAPIEYIRWKRLMKRFNGTWNICQCRKNERNSNYTRYPTNSGWKQTIRRTERVNPLSVFIMTDLFDRRVIDQ